MSIHFLTPTLPSNSVRAFSEKIDTFNKSSGQNVVHTQYDWSQYWRELVNVSIYHTGGDVAEIGSTWLESLASMNVLRPFTADEIAKIGGQDAFFPILWQTFPTDGVQQAWSIPYRVDVRTLVYWDDMVEKAGLDPATAFATTESLKESLIALQKHYPTPWVVPTAITQNTIYHIASWIHGSGGSFLTPNNKKTAFASRQALAGIRAYFDLYPFIPPAYHPISDDSALEIFADRKVAVTACGPWIYQSMADFGLSPELIRHARTALMPGPAFVGGTSLVVWKHAANMQAVMGLIKSIFEPDFITKLTLNQGHLPVQKEFWTQAYLDTNPNLPIFRDAILTGRGVPAATLWGVVEDRLRTTLGQIWKDLYSLKTPPSTALLDEILEDRIVGLARRLDITLEG